MATRLSMLKFLDVNPELLEALRPLKEPAGHSKQTDKDEADNDDKANNVSNAED